MRSPLRWLAAGLCMLASTIVFGASPGQSDYLAGLEAMRSKQWTQAAGAFAKACSADDENADYHAAAAICAMLAGDKATAQHEDDLRGHAKDPARLDAVANFLLEESDDPGEQLCPNGPFRAYRDAHPDQEIARADKLFRDAMVANPKDVTAMAGAAEILLRQGQYADGETLVRRALQIDPRDPRVLQLLSKTLDYAADLRSGQAAELRTPRTWISQTGPDYIVWTTRYPSDAEKQRADQLDAIARQLWEQSREQLVAAVQTRKGTAEGAYYAGLLAMRDDNTDGAIAEYQQAVKMEPNSKRFRTGLIRAYVKAGRKDLAANEQETLVLQRQTTANMRYAMAWNDLDRIAYKTVQKELDGALPMDPCDERSASYRGVLVQAQKQAREAIIWYSTALAFNEAKLRLDALTAAPDNKAALPRRHCRWWLTCGLARSIAISINWSLRCWRSAAAQAVSSACPNSSGPRPGRKRSCPTPPTPSGRTRHRWICSRHGHTRWRATRCWR